MEHTGPLVSQVLAPQRGYALQSGKEYDSRYLAHVSSRAPTCGYRKAPAGRRGRGLVEGKGDGYLSPWPSNCGDACAGMLPDHALDHVHNDDGE